MPADATTRCPRLSRAECQGRFSAGFLGHIDVRGLPGLVPRRDMTELVGPLRLAELGWRQATIHGRSAVVVDILWRGDAPHVGVGRDSLLTGFVHLLGPSRADGSAVWAGSDGPPSSGGWSMAASGAGLFDRHVLHLPPELTPGVYALEIGAYDRATMQRLDVSGPLADESMQRILISGLRIDR